MNKLFTKIILILVMAGLLIGSLLASSLSTIHQMEALELAYASYNKAAAVQARTELAKTKEIVSFGKSDGLVSFNMDSANPIITIAFHGTEETSDWLTNFDFGKTKAKDIGIEGSTHKGFLNRYLGMKDAMSAAIQSVLAKFSLAADRVSFMFTGHSLGGALATLAAVDHKKKLNAHVALVTACSPRVFSKTAAGEVEKLFGQDHMARFWRSLDPVSAVAPGILGFKHVGTSLKVPARDTWNLFSNHEILDIIDWLATYGIDKTDKKHVGVMTRLKKLFGYAV